MKNTLSHLRTITCLVCFAISVCLVANSQTPDEPQTLQPGQTLEREMTGAATHRYKLDLNANEFFQVRVEQTGVDVMLKLIDADGKVLAAMDSPNSKEGHETLTFVAANTGKFILEVSSFDAKAEKGIYTITREPSRAATEKDKRRVEVERLFVEGVTARTVVTQRELTVEMLKQALAGWEELGDTYLVELTAQQLKQFTQAPPEINAALAKIESELQNALKLLGEGQKLAARSSADSLSAREKLNHALEMFRSVNTKAKDKALIDKINHSGETAKQSLNSLKILEFHSKIGEALSLGAIAQTHKNLNERQEAIDLTKQANNVYQEIISDKTFLSISGIDVKKTIPTWKFHYAAGLNEVGHGLAQYFGKSEEGIKFLSQSAEGFHSLYEETHDIQNKILEAYSLTMIANIYARESKSKDKAIEFFTKALAIYQSIPNENENVASALTNIGRQQFLNYDFKEGLENCEKALAIYREIKDKSGESDVLRLISMIYFVLNNKAKVAEYVSQYLAILQSQDYIESRKKRLKLAPDTFGIYQELNNALIENFNLDGIAFAYRLLEDYQKSLEYYEKALAVSHSLKDIRDFRLSITSVAYTFAKLEKWDKAAEFYKQALEISRENGVREDIADDLDDVGWTLLEAGKYQEALQYQHEALLTYQSVEVDENKSFSTTYSNLLNEISRTHYALGNKRLAIFYGKRAVNAMQGERQRLQNLDPLSQKGFLEKKEKHYRRLADWLIEEHRIIEAEQVLAMLKDEEVNSYLRRDVSEADKLQKRADLKPEEKDALTRYNKIGAQIASIGAEYDKLRDELSRLSKQGLKPTAEQQKRYDELSRQVTDANNIFQAFLKQLADEFAKRNLTRASVEEDLALQSQLKEWGEGVVFLYTLVGEDRYRVILTTPKIKTDGKSEIKSVDLDKKISDFRKVIQNPKLDPRPLGKELYDLLIKPIEKQLDGTKAKTLLWSLDGNLRLLPIAALWDGKQYFGQKYQNVIFTVASRSRLGEVNSANWRVLGLGVSDPKVVAFKELDGTTRNIPFTGLPAVRNELGKIVADKNNQAGVLPGKVLLNSEFNEKNFINQLINGYKVIHIASHFNLNAGDARQSFLLLGDGNALTVSEIKTNTEVDFSGVDLLTLSACQTAVVERDSNGKEIEGFGYVAQQKGAKAILATLWSVADESTSLLMSEFYHLRKVNPQMTKAAALQAAQQEMLSGKFNSLNSQGTRRDTSEADAASSPDYTHPYYWSPFILIGNWR